MFREFKKKKKKKIKEDTKRASPFLCIIQKTDEGRRGDFLTNTFDYDDETALSLFVCLLVGGGVVEAVVEAVVAMTEDDDDDDDDRLANHL